MSHNTAKTHKKTYLITDEGDRVLVYEEWQNAAKNVLTYIDHQSDDDSRGYYEYDEFGQLMREREMAAGEEVNRQEFQYQEDGRLLNQKTFVDDTLYEETRFEELEQGYLTQTLQMGEVTERMLQSKDQRITRTEYLNEGKPFEIHETTIDPKTKAENTTVSSSQGQVLGTIIKEWQEHNSIHDAKSFDRKGNVIEHISSEYKGGRLIKQRSLYQEAERNSTIHFEYDEHGNEIAMEETGPNGELVGFHKLRYDEQNRLIRENGLSAGFSEGIYVSYWLGQTYTFEHEYIAL